MLRLLRQTVCPKLGLVQCLTNWYDISAALREPPRKRGLQTEGLEDVLRHGMLS